VGLLARCEAVKEIEVIAVNKDLLSLSELSGKIRTTYVEADLDLVQVKSMKVKGLKKVQFSWKVYKAYKSIILKINKSNFDLVLFTSQGLLSFWLAARTLKVKYAISVVSIKWIYEKNSVKFPLYLLFKSFIRKSVLNLFFEEYYKDIVNHYVQTNSLVMPDRALKISCNEADKRTSGYIQLVTLGTISSIKSPVMFLNEWKNLPTPVVSGFHYKIHGKVMDQLLLSKINFLLKECSRVNFVDDYISETSYNAMLEGADFAVIPYSQDYTKHLTSGVMWDCFERQKAIFCPNIEPFRYYVSKFKIGFLYDDGKLDEALINVIEQKDSFFSELPRHYKKLVELNSEDRLSTILQTGLLTAHI
jgi:hypothetical protein